MSTFTDDRAAKLAGNLSTPPVEPIEGFAHRLDAAGVKVDRPGVTTEHVTGELTPSQGQEISGDLPTLYQLLLAQRSRLSFIVDSLGANGYNILSENGVKLVRGAELEQDKLNAIDLSFEESEQILQRYEIFRKWLDKGLDGFDGIVGIVDGQNFEGQGQLKPIDIFDERGLRLEDTFKSYIKDWVESGLGDPSLLEMSTQEQLQAVSNFPDALRAAYDLKHPEEAGRVSGDSLSYSLGEEFPRMTISRVEGKDGRDFMLGNNDPGPEVINPPSGPIAR